MPSHPVLPMRPLGHPALRRGIQGIPALVSRPFYNHLFSLLNRLRCGHPVIPHSDAGFRKTRLGQPNLFIISFFSLPNRLWCGHPVIPYFDAVSRNTGKFTRKILFPGPRIAVRGDTVLDVVSRIYPLFIPKENSRQYRPGHWGARPVHPESPFSFPAKEKGKPKESSRLMSES